MYQDQKISGLQFGDDVSVPQDNNLLFIKLDFTSSEFGQQNCVPNFEWHGNDFAITIKGTRSCFKDYSIIKTVRFLKNDSWFSFGFWLNFSDNDSVE